MSTHDLLPLSATLLGGALAVIGGFLGDYLLRRIAEKKSHREFLKAKLERVFLKSVEVVNLISQMRSKMLQVFVKAPEQAPEPWPVDCAMAEMRLVASFYCPALQPSIDAIEAQIHDFYQQMGKFYLVFMESQVDRQQAMACFKKTEPIWAELKKAHEALLAKLRELAKAQQE
jgi:hypothetical protein